MTREKNSGWLWIAALAALVAFSPIVQPVSATETGDETHDLQTGDLNLARAYWVLSDTLAWNSQDLPEDATVAMHTSADGNLALGDEGVTGADHIFTLTPIPEGLPAKVTEKFPHLTGYLAFHLDLDESWVQKVLMGQLAMASSAADGTPLDATGLQIPGVVDDVYPYDGPLGVEIDGEDVTLRVWAPTAKSVELLLFDSSDPAAEPVRVAMDREYETGVWSATGELDWIGQYYLYEAEVWAPSTGRVEINQVTDPYSLSLSADSARSQIVDLDDAALKPRRWDQFLKPRYRGPQEISIYELHVRDFSWIDAFASDENRGTYNVFAQVWSNGLRHLRLLTLWANLSHVQVMPAFDFATVPERRADQVEPDFEVLASYPADSEMQQAAIAAASDQDGFSWGYTPWHYTVPEGSYSTDPDGSQRILEFRRMVQGLNRLNLRVVMDVAYSHTFAAGQDDASVLDRLVPGYYHRQSTDGIIETSSGYANTATEHAMMERLMIDSLRTWATDYKVDGFRFHLMGHHPKSTIVKVRETLDALNLRRHGVNGQEIVLYGEDLNFGEVADGARFEQALAENLTGTGIGTFNARSRDGIRGGSSLGGLQDQGFVTGLSYDPNATDQGTPEEQRARLLHETDWIRVSLAGGLKNFPLIDRNGDAVVGSQIDYGGQPAGYTDDPQEAINYVATHDGETLFDDIQLQMPEGASMTERIRAQNLANSLIALGQGMPFFHAGQDMLRSKSMDRNSFNSGDWFNRLDYSYQSNSWGSGLPAAAQNQDNWPTLAPLLANSDLQPTSADIASVARHLHEMMRIRRSSRLFRLPTEADVIERLGFLNTGPDQIPGMIAMTLNDGDGAFDRWHERILVVFNSTGESQNLSAPSLASLDFQRHWAHRTSRDPVVQTAAANRGFFSIPSRTTVVYTARRSLADRITLLIGDVDRLVLNEALEAGAGQALRAELEAALAAIETGDQDRYLEAFRDQVEALVANEQLSDAHEQELTGYASGVFGQPEE